MATTMALVNQKGGVGKTTSTINLAATLLERGMRVLAVDMDPQASLTEFYGFDPGFWQDSLRERVTVAR